MGHHSGHDQWTFTVTLHNVYGFDQVEFVDVTFDRL